MSLPLDTTTKDEDEACIVACALIRRGIPFQMGVLPEHRFLFAVGPDAAQRLLNLMVAVRKGPEAQG